MIFCIPREKKLEDNRTESKDRLCDERKSFSTNNPSKMIKSKHAKYSVDGKYLKSKKGKKKLAMVLRLNQIISTPYVTERVSIKASGPDLKQKKSTREKFFMVDEEKVIQAEAFWIPNSCLNECMKEAKKLIGYFNVSTVGKYNKGSANGTCFEFGVGVGPGKQSTSFEVGKINAQLNYLRNHKEFNKVMEDLYNPIETALFKECKKSFPDVFQEGSMWNEYGTSDRSVNAVLSGMCTVKGGFPYLQRAIRLHGCPKNPSKWRYSKASEGGSTLHHDKMDFPYRKGNLIIYLNPWENSFNGADLLIFNQKNGGNAAKIPTMVAGYVCLVLIPSNACLHGSEFPELPLCAEKFSNLGNVALKVVLYTLKASVKFSQGSKDNTNEFMNKWKDAILCLSKEYQWRHAKVYNSVCDNIIKTCNIGFEKIKFEY